MYVNSQEPPLVYNYGKHRMNNSHSLTPHYYSAHPSGVFLLGWLCSRTNKAQMGAWHLFVNSRTTTAYPEIFQL